MSRWVPVVALVALGALALAALASDLSDRLDIDITSLPLLRSGDQGEWVQTLQQALNALGYDPGAVDGIMGPRTETAVKEFQIDYGLKADGLVGRATWEALTRNLLEMGSVPPESLEEAPEKPQEVLPPLGLLPGLSSGPAGDEGHDEASEPQTDEDTDLPEGEEPQELGEREPEAYVVQRGDTVFSISRRFQMSVEDLVRLNQLENPDHIEAGQTLRIKSDTLQETREEPEPVDADAGRTWHDAGWFTYIPARSAPITEDPKTPSEEPGAQEESLPVALTFNGGPHPEITARILDVLEAKEVRATFFVVGQEAASVPDLVRRMALNHHQVENRSYSGVNFLREGLSWAQMRAEIRETAEIIYQLTGRSTTYFRPPAGSWDEAVATASSREDHSILLWSNIGALDTPFPGEEELARRLAQVVFPGAVLMLRADSHSTAEALPHIIDTLRERGVEFYLPQDIPGGPLPGLLYDPGR